MGLSVNRVKVWGVRSHGCVQHAGRSIVTARLDSAQPNTGLGYEMDDIAAVVMGGRHSRVARGHLVAASTTGLALLFVHRAFRFDRGY